MTTITVIKRDIQGQEILRYQGRLLKRNSNLLILEAFFNLDNVHLPRISIQKGDRFIETYFSDRWYTIYEVHAYQDDHLRGWYCDITFPIEIRGNTLLFTDLALDLLVLPNGEQLILDEEEFDQLPISPLVRERARTSLAELQNLFKLKLAERASHTDQELDLLFFNQNQ